MQENRLFEALLDVIPFAAYAVDIETFEVVYANKMMTENMYAPREEFCWKKVAGQDEMCSWCTVSELKQRSRKFKNEKTISSYFDEVTDTWFQAFDELVSWPDGRTVKYTILIDITEQKEIQASMIKTHTKLAIQSKKLKEANEKLQFLSKKDYLTGIDNRRNYFTKALKIFETQFDDGFYMYVGMLDIDKFKDLNDTYGHAIGDEALKIFTQEVENHLDEGDIFGRLGGEEFAVITIHNNETEVLKKFDNIKEGISQLVINKGENPISFTVSIGIDRKEITDETIDEIHERADKKLYEAKDSGRNRIKFRI